MRLLVPNRVGDGRRKNAEKQVRIFCNDGTDLPKRKVLPPLNFWLPHPRLNRLEDSLPKCHAMEGSPPWTLLNPSTGLGTQGRLADFSSNSASPPRQKSMAGLLQHPHCYHRFHMKRVCENWILVPRRFLRSQGLTTKWNCVKHLQIFTVMTIQRSLQSCVRGASCLSCVELGGRGSHGKVNPIIIYI